jgi:hypothetical protein
MILGKLGIHIQNNEMRPLSHQFKKNNKKKKQKWIKDLTVTPESLKLLEGNTGRMLEGIDLGKNFIDETTPPKYKKQKQKWTNWVLLN